MSYLNTNTGNSRTFQIASFPPKAKVCTSSLSGFVFCPPLRISRLSFPGSRVCREGWTFTLRLVSVTAPLGDLGSPAAQALPENPLLSGFCSGPARGWGGQGRAPQSVPRAACRPHMSIGLQLRGRASAGAALRRERGCNPTSSQPCFHHYHLFFLFAIF